jgi:hypothetical protein
VPEVREIPNDPNPRVIQKLLQRLAGDVELRCWYEADRCG